MKGIEKRVAMDRLAIVRTTTMKAISLIAVLVLVGVSERVHAYVKICNHTSAALDVAIAYGVKDAPGTSTGGHRGVVAEGWWEVAPNQCAQPSSIDAGNHYLYYRARSKAGNSNGQSLLCVQNKPFTLPQQFRREGDRCPAGQYLTGFKRIDATKKNHTLNLR